MVSRWRNLCRLSWEYFSCLLRVELLSKSTKQLRSSISSPNLILGWQSSRVNIPCLIIVRSSKRLLGLSHPTQHSSAEIVRSTYLPFLNLIFSTLMSPLHTSASVRLDITRHIQIMNNINSTIFRHHKCDALSDQIFHGNIFYR